MIKAVWCTIFYVPSLEKAAKFYEETLGLEKKLEYSSYVDFECGGVEIELILKLKELQKISPASPSVEFLVDDVKKVCDKLKSKGVRSIKELHEEPWGGKQATFTNPDGNILEITQINWKKYFTVSAEGVKRRRETQ
ncbi:VOC family protein [Candidatus Bathyarchaeota archaeon]|nr:VOC family protein [Candidatus Bathyarchaeota archaeon]